MRRIAFALLALALFVSAQQLAPSERERPNLPGHPLVAALGPLRPIVAELVRLRFDSSRLAERVLGQLDDAWTVLALRPDRPDEFAFFGSYFVFDAPTLVIDPAERRVLERAGLEIFEWGRRLHPADWRLTRDESYALDHLLKESGDRSEVETLRARLLERCEELVARPPALDDAGRGILRESLAIWIHSMVTREESTAPLASRAREVARRLLEWPDLSAKAREELQESIR
jgi:hypothetical protein